jgi:O-6-methylguanine DNA methyltransferase
MNELKAFKVNTKYGYFFFNHQGSSIFSIYKKLEKIPLIRTTKILEKTALQLILYFEGKINKFNILYVEHESKFLNDSYNTFLNIPYGKTISYKELAFKTKHTNVNRAVGTTMAKNRVHFIVPCEVVIKNNGTPDKYVFCLKIKSDLNKTEARSN